MRDPNPLLTTLYILRTIGEHQPTAEWLADYYGMCDRTLKRHIVAARGLGAELETTKMMDGRYHWTCPNWATIQQRGLLSRWIALEEERERLTQVA